MLTFTSLSFTCFFEPFPSLQPLAPPPPTQPKTSPITCPPSPAGKPTGGRGTAAPGRSTCPSPQTSSRSTPLAATCPRAAWATSSPRHPVAPGACRTRPLRGEVIGNVKRLVSHLHTKKSRLRKKKESCSYFFPDSVSKTSTPSFGKNGKAAGQQGSPWETLVVFAINLKQLTVQMNMSNVMGNNT